MDRLRIGVIGLGWFGEIHAETIAGVANLAVATWIADTLAFDQLILTLRDALGFTVFLITHDLDTLYTITDRVAVLYLGILSSGVAYGLLNFANSHLTVSESSLFSNVTTVVSVLAGVLFLKEDFSLWQALGVVIILVCVFVANVSGGEKK